MYITYFVIINPNDMDSGTCESVPLKHHQSLCNIPPTHTQAIDQADVVVA
jgi:hypothetical protein